MRVAVSAGTLSLLGIFTVGTTAAYGAPCPGLGVAAPFAILGGAGVTTTGGSSVVGAVGSAVSLSTATTVVPGLVDGLLGTVNGLLGGTDVVADTAARSAVGASASAYQSAAADVPTHALSGSALLNATLSPGVYAWPHSLSLGGFVTLDALGNRRGTFIFQIPGNLVSAAQSAVSLKDGAQAGNVLWQVGGAVRLAPSTSLVGTVLADHDITLERGTSLLGRAQSLTGLVNLDASTVTLPPVVTDASAAIGAVTSRTSTVVPTSGASIVPSGTTTTCTCAVSSLVPNVLPLIPLSAIAAPDLAVPSGQVGDAAGLVPGILGVVPLGEVSLPVNANSNSGSSVSVPTVALPSTTSPSISTPLSGVGLPALVSPATSPSVPSATQLVPNLALPALVTPDTSSSVPNVLGLAPNLSLPSLVSPSTATPGVTQLVPNLSLPSVATPSLPSILLPRLSTPSSTTSPGRGSFIHARAKPSSPGSHAKASAHAKSTTTTVPSGTSIPVGAPATGEGGSAGWGSRMLVALGALMLALGSAVLGIRRRPVRG